MTYYSIFPIFILPHNLPRLQAPNTSTAHRFPPSIIIYNSLAIGRMGNCENGEGVNAVHVPTLGKLGPVVDL